VIETVEQLEDLLSLPSEKDVAAMRSLEGDLLILGVGGKMGPSLARRARRAIDLAGVRKRVIGVARFSNGGLARELDSAGVETIQSDLLDTGALAALPDVPNVIFMAAKKFGTTGAEHSTWAMNTFLPGLVAERYCASRIVAFSTGNVYPLRPIEQGGAIETTPVAPVGEYAQSALGRERMFEYGSDRWRTPVTLLRLNYAVELRYGVLLDIGLAVKEGRPVDLRMGVVNVIWQGDANSVCLRSFAHCQTPPLVLNLTGPETLPVRYIAERFAAHFNVQPVWQGVESPNALTSNASKVQQLFGYPSVTPNDIIDWTADWIARGGTTLNKPTHFQTRDGKF
jgi:nucleoside-diphosphate-sugar epimerase